MNAESIAISLGRYSRNSGGGFIACCPAHPDKNPSLAIVDSDNGVLVKCFAGCEQGAVIEALQGLNLWPVNDNPMPAARTSTSTKIWRPIVPIPDDAPKPPKEHYRHGKPALSWDYRDAKGSLLQVVCRFNTDNGKQVLPLTYCTNGNRSEWRWQGLPEPRPLYGLELLDNKKDVVAVEGEKPTDAARRLLGPSIPVVTWPGGCNAVKKADWSPMSGLSVAIWPDADLPGIKAAIAVAEACLAAGAESVKIVEPPPDVTQGWDLADAEVEGWSREEVLSRLKAGLTLEEFKKMYLPEATSECSASRDDDAPVAWEEPLMFGQTTTPDIPATILPGWLGDYVGAVSATAKTPPGMAVMLALSTVSTCLQKKFIVFPRGTDYHEPVNIWTVTSLPPSSRKTYVITALTDPISIWELEQSDRMADSIRQTKTKREVNLARIAKLTTQAANTDDPQKRDVLLYKIDEARKDTPDELRLPRLWTGDVTPERLQMLLAEHGEKMALLSDEGGIFEIMGGLYSDGKVNLDVFLQAHAGKSVRVDRASRTAHLNSPALTFGLAVQPSVISDLANGSKKRFRGNGSLARFLYCLPKNNIGMRDVRKNEPIPEVIKAKYHARIIDMLNIAPEVDGKGIEQPRRLILDADALECWLAFSEYIESKQGPNGEYEPIQDWTGKLPGAALRLAGLLHVVEHGVSTAIINQATMVMVLDLATLLIEHAKAAFSLMGADPITDDAKAIFKWISVNDLESFTKNKVRVAMKGRWAKPERLTKALKELQDRDILGDHYQGKTGGRYAMAYPVNPLAFGRGVA